MIDVGWTCPQWDTDERMHDLWVVDGLLRFLSKRARQIVELRYGLDDDGGKRTYAEVGKMLGLSAGYVGGVVKRSLGTMMSAPVAQRRLIYTPEKLAVEKLKRLGIIRPMPPTPRLPPPPNQPRPYDDDRWYPTDERWMLKPGWAVVKATWPDTGYRYYRVGDRHR